MDPKGTEGVERIAEGVKLFVAFELRQCAGRVCAGARWRLDVQSPGRWKFRTGVRSRAGCSYCCQGGKDATFC